MGYHIRKISKGTLGSRSKITEEYEEFLDAYDHNNTVMELLELSDLLGAIEAYIQSYNITLYQLITMMNATKRAFQDGTRS